MNRRTWCGGLASVLCAALLLSGCGKTPADSTAEPNASGTTTSVTGTASSTGASGTFSSAESTTTSATTGTTADSSADTLAAGLYSAHDELAAMLREGAVSSKALWRPVYLDANCENGWKNMKANEETFSMKLTDFALPFVFIPEYGGVLLNANQWADGGIYWDKAGLMYKAPCAHSAILKAGSITSISAASETEAGALTTTEGRVAIYKNDKKIWPTDRDFAVIRAGEPVEFPELALELEKGDVIVIEAYGAAPGRDTEITDDTKGEWRNHILMDPVMEVLG